jgi:hypothetical protein
MSPSPGKKRNLLDLSCDALEHPKKQLVIRATEERCFGKHGKLLRLSCSVSDEKRECQERGPLEMPARRAVGRAG